LGDSHYKSNLIAKSRGINVTGFSTVTVATIAATNLAVGTNQTVGGTMVVTGRSTSAVAASAPTVHGTTKLHAGSYVKLGTGQYIFFGSSTTSATIVAEATALVGTPIRGSLYLSKGATRGGLYTFVTDSTASPSFV